MKAELKVLLDERIKAVESILPGFDTWAQEWEKHHFPDRFGPFPSSPPWDEYSLEFTTERGTRHDVHTHVLNVFE